MQGASAKQTDRFDTSLVSGKGCKSPAAPADVMLTTPQKPLIERLGRAGENEAKPEDLPAGN